MIGHVVAPIACNEPVSPGTAVLLLRNIGPIPLFFAEQRPSARAASPRYALGSFSIA
jgi:hypothetical protein